MILVDINLLVTAVMDQAIDHEPTRDWLQERLAGTARVGLPWTSLLGFVRVAGQRRAFEHPLPLERGLEIVRSWLERPSVWIPEPGPKHLELLAPLLGPHPRSRLVTDAHLAAIAIEHGLELCSRDHDFARWQLAGLRWSDPIA